MTCVSDSPTVVPDFQTQGMDGKELNNKSSNSTEGNKCNANVNIKPRV